MKKIVFVYDSSFDIPKDYDIGIDNDFLPLRVYVDGKEYFDKIDITDEEIYKYLLEDRDVKTSLPIPKDTEEKILRLSKEYDKVYILTISSMLSGTNNMVRNIIEDKKLKNVVLLDSKSGSVKTTYVGLRVINAIKHGVEVTQEIVDQFVRESLLVFTVTSLKFLEKGGRIGKAKALLGRLLKIKPILSTDDEGETTSLDMARTTDGSVEKIINLGKEFSKKFGKNYVVIGGYGVGSIKQYLDRILEPFENIIGVSRIGPAIAVHVGPEVFGFVIGRGFSE